MYYVKTKLDYLEYKENIKKLEKELNDMGLL